MSEAPLAGIRLGPVALQVADLARSLDYYQGTLGLRLADRTANHAHLTTEDGRTSLIHLHASPGARPAAARGRLGLFHFAILLPDRTALGRFAGHLATREVRLGASDHLVSEALYLHDPDGLGIEVYADRPRSAWRRVGEEFEMDTLPLDLGALMSAGGGVPWTGMPAGTVMGHMHLHAGDLSAAARFYEHGLGLRATVRRYPGALFLAADGYHHHLGLNTWAGPGAVPAGEQDARLLAWELHVRDAAQIELAARRLADDGHPVEREAGGVAIRDPWGTTLRLRQEPATTA